MTQHIDIQYRQKAESQTLNKRFRDITGPSVLLGFRLQKGIGDFSVDLVRGGFNSSVAISPSGAKVEETTDLMDALTIEPNTEPSGLPRVDSVYLVYSFGTPDTFATYEVRKGTSVPSDNPNTLTHLLLGYVYVQPNNAILRKGDFVSVPYGFSKLEVAGKSLFHGEVTFDQTVTFKGPVNMTGGGTGGGTSSPTFVKRLPAPIIALPKQQSFTLPSAYVMNTQTLFVYKDGELQPPSEWQEVDNVTFKFHDPLVGGEEVWAFWYEGLSVYTPASHNHDDLYYRKWEIANRAVRYATDFFSGSSGRRINHYLGHTNYIVISVIPIEKSAEVGEITVEKREDEIIVYNTGNYRGKFDLTYMIKAPYDTEGGNEVPNEFNIASSGYDEKKRVYTILEYKRKDGTLYMKSTLLNANAQGKYTRLSVAYYNTTGTQVIETKVWALNYDSAGVVISKTMV